MLVYRITNRLNGKSYIGKTKRATPNERWWHHRNFGLSPINAAIAKYGDENFSFQVLIDNVLDIETLDLLEKRLIRIHKTKVPNGYNVTDGGDGGTTASGDNHWMRKYPERRPSRVGELNGRAKLSRKQVVGIRTLGTKLSQRSIAGIFGITQQTVSKILRNERWSQT